MKDAVYVSIGSLTSAGAAFLAQALIARNIEPHEYGQLMSNLALLNTLTPLAAFGLPQLLQKINGKFKGNIKRWNQGIVELNIAMSAITLVILFPFIYLIGDNNNYRLILIMSPLVFAIGFSLMVTSIKQIELDFKSTMVWQSINNILRLMAVFLVLNIVSINSNINSYAIGYSIASIILIVISLTQLFKFKNKYTNIQMVNYKKIPLNKIFKLTWMYGLEGLMYLVYYSLPIILTKHYLGDEKAGLIAVSTAIIAAVCLIPVAINQKFILPKLHYDSYHDRYKIKKLLNRRIVISIVLGMLVSIVMIIISEKLINYIYGKDYSASVVLLMMHALILPFRFAAYPADGYLGTRNYQKSKLKIMMMQVILCVIFVIFGASNYDVEGVIMGLILCEVVYFIFVNKAAFKYNKCE